MTWMSCSEYRRWPPVSRCGFGYPYRRSQARIVVAGTPVRWTTAAVLYSGVSDASDGMLRRQALSLSGAQAL